MQQNQQIKIAIVDDHKLFRKGLITLIRGINERRYHILFEAENGQDFISKIDHKVLPDIVIMDIEMNKMNGFETVAWLQKYHPDINILVVSMVETEEAIIRMLRLGVKGYLSKDIETEDLSQALRQIADKGYYYTDFVTGKLIHAIKEETDEEAGRKRQLKTEIWQNLTERERKFIELACSEKTYDEIASDMFVSIKTVDGYRASVFKKIQVKSRVGLVLYAVKHKLVYL